MDDAIYLSVRLTNGSIRVFKNTVRSLNNPRYVCFYINADKALLALRPYHKKSLKSHKIPINLYTETGAMVIYSKMFCGALYNAMNWDKSVLYRIPGKLLANDKIAVFDLKRAEIHDEEI